MDLSFLIAAGGLRAALIHASWAAQIKCMSADRPDRCALGLPAEAGSSAEVRRTGEPGFVH
jgi:hypothetical protein